MYGIKIQALVIARLFYTINLEGYLGVQPAGPYAVENSITAVTKRMIQLISDTGRNVTMDNWYPSVPLAEDLLTQYNLTVVGILKKNKPEIPDDFKKKGREVSSSLFRFGKNHSTLVSYCPKKNKVVLQLSTMHNDASGSASISYYLALLTDCATQGGRLSEAEKSVIFPMAYSSVRMRNAKQ
ncbi:hypothetical protein EVAR_36819_1 [Eumeta japonica]|uniref:PiggyBac transposable element-derived protein domain-containing protein n=1 Tax=Eumeta variegata TaxID=151549 RepID=A0A4C1WYV3_EUMVA|nr:hypothetical protein EVAR_36819_1 [Eumeta japonica]